PLRGAETPPGGGRRQILGLARSRGVFGNLGLRLARAAQPRQDLERARDPPGLAGVTLDLARRGLRQAAGAQQDDLPDGDLVLGSDRPPDRLARGARLRFPPPLDLGDDDQPLLARDVHREGRHAPTPDRGVRGLRRRFEILRIVIAPAQDHQVLRAAGDEQLAVANEAEVAGAQVGPRAANEARPEGAFGLLVPVPVTESDARAPEPDLSHPAGRPLRAGVRIDDRQILAGPRPAATDEPAPARLARSGRL